MEKVGYQAHPLRHFLRHQKSSRFGKDAAPACASGIAALRRRHGTAGDQSAPLFDRMNRPLPTIKRAAYSVTRIFAVFDTNICSRRIF
jgi:hypothetical protein